MPPPLSPVPSAPPRTDRRAAVRRAARQAARQTARQAHHPTPLATAAPPVVAALAADGPLYDAALTLLTTVLAPDGHSRPTCKRLALLVTGLLAGPRGTPSAVAHTAFTLGIGTAQQEPSVARRVARLLDDPHLDPARLLPPLARAVLPVLLADAARAHDHSIGAGARPSPHHARWRGVRLVVDETTHTDQTHVLVVGLAYRGVVVPLGLRTWPQTAPQPLGAYWDRLASLLLEVHSALPPALRPHVLVLGDRFYGVPPVLDLLSTLGWACVLRVQGQTRVCLPDGTERALRTLVPRPGTYWTGYELPFPAAEAAPAAAPLAVFKSAGWRALQVVAAWVPGQAEPWLLVTTLPATCARLRDYAIRWAIERLFLGWKSHGWDLEATAAAPRRLARLLTGYVVATWWLLAAALPVATAHLAALAAHRGRAPRHPVQLPLPWSAPAVPWPAKRSLLTYGRQAFAQVDARVQRPPLCWRFPAWDAPAWSTECTALYHGSAT